MRGIIARVSAYLFNQSIKFMNFFMFPLILIIFVRGEIFKSMDGVDFTEKHIGYADISFCCHDK